MSAPQLRQYQTDSLNAIADAREKGSNRVLIKKPTGTGKTVTFAAMLKFPRLAKWLETLPKKGARMLVIAHREELLDQAQDKIQKANPGLMVSIEQGDRYANRYSDVVIASIQTLSAMKFRRLLNLLRYHSFPLVIVDEAHHAAAASYRTALVHLGFLPPAEASGKEDIEAADFDDVGEMEKALAGWDATAPKDRLLVGVTATPNRSDAIGLGCVFQTIAYSYALKDAITNGHLVPITPWVIETEALLDDVRTSHGDFNQKDLAQAVNNERRNQLAVAAWQEHAPAQSTIAFTVDVAHAHDLSREFERSGIRARAISGETPKDDRRTILRQYTEGQIEVITNCMVLTEGTDLPRTRCILHAKPTKSATLYEQMTGRGLRPYPNKPDCIVIDLVDVARRHSLQAAPVLYGLPPGVLTKGENLKKLADDLEALAEKYNGFDIENALANGRLTLAQLQAKASTFDIWNLPQLAEAIRAAVSMNWILTGDETYRLQYPWQDGTETLQVQKDMLGHFELVSTFRERALGTDPHQKTPPAPGHYAGARPAARQRTMAAGIPSSLEALKLAEAFVLQERRAVARLKDREAPWRVKPASPGQLGYLRKLRVPFNQKGLTSGQASDLIDMAQQRRSR